MNDRDELMLLRKKLLHDIRKFGRVIAFWERIEESIWHDKDQADRIKLEKEIASYCLDKSQKELYKVDSVLQTTGG